MQDVEITGSPGERFDEVLTADALAFVARLHHEFDRTRRELLAARAERQQELDAGGTLGFLPQTEDLRADDWTIAPEPDALCNRRVEITGPTSRKMVINALNSGATGFMADFEDSNSPTWANMIGGQVNLADAVRGTIEHDENGKHYELDDEVATLLVRPRGWHLVERHLLVDGEPVAGGLVDFGLYVFHNARELLERGAGPYFYLPKLESHREARLWNDVFDLAEDEIGLERGTIKATVLIETLPAAFEMDEILYELREHSAGLNAGRWDYIFSAIKRFRTRPEFVTPDRNKVTMTVPFMRAYTELLVKTCHRRGAHAMGGMAAQIPSRSDEQANEKAFAALRADKRREASDGFDGTWVAHPDSVAAAMEEFDKVLADRPHQLDRRRDDVEVSAEQLLDVPGHRRRHQRAGPAQQHQRRHPVHLVVAARQRRGRHPRDDGRRRDGRDRPRAGVAVGAPRRAARRRACDHRRLRARARDVGAREHPSADRRRRLVRERGPPRPLA